MPCPVSRTWIWTLDWSRANVTSTRPPVGVNFTALDTKFQTTLEPDAIGHSVSRQRIKAHVERNAPRLRRRAHGIDPGVDDLGEIAGPDLQAQLARHNARHVQEIVNRLHLRFGVALDHREALLEVRGLRVLVA